jgi:hypothetical protein
MLEKGCQTETRTVGSGAPPRGRTTIPKAKVRGKEKMVEDLGSL